MSGNRQEYLDIISIVSHLARSDGDVADSEKKVLMTLKVFGPKWPMNFTGIPNGKPYLDIIMTVVTDRF